MESELGSGSSKHSISYTEVTVSESDLLSPGEKSGSSSPPSFSSSSYDGNFFPLDKNRLSKFNVNSTSPPRHDEDTQLASRDGEEDVPNGYYLNYEAYVLASPGSISPPAPESSLHSRSVTQSPPIQLMVRSDDYSSHRIPSSVFARSKSNIPMEWSVCSNESLFSINVGNNSFSRDYFSPVSMSGELSKSGKLIFPNTKSKELYFPNTNPVELIFSDNPPPASAIVDPEKKSSDSGVGMGVAEMAAATMKEVQKSGAEDCNKELVAAEDCNKEQTPHAKGFHHSSKIIPHHSDGSLTGINSSDYPVRKRRAWKNNDSNRRCAFCHFTWPFCSCSSCSSCFWPFSHCTRPSCYCCNCSWACCYRSNCFSTCCCSPPILKGEGRKGDSLKTEPEQSHKQLKPHAPRASQKVGKSKWLSCCSNCPSSQRVGESKCFPRCFSCPSCC